MPFLIVLAFIVVPLVELTAIGQVQDLLGWPITIAILVADSVMGAVLVRQEGTRAWQAFTGAMAAGRPPATEAVDGALIMFGGALLLTPGFVTDIVGLVCVLRPTRAAINRLLVKRFAAGPKLRGMGATKPDRGPRARSDRPDRSRPPVSAPDPDVIDVEVLDVQRNPRRNEPQ